MLEMITRKIETETDRLLHVSAGWQWGGEVGKVMLSLRCLVCYNICLHCFDLKN